VLLREQSRWHLANDSGRWRLIGCQAGVGRVLRLKERVEPESEQTQYGQIHRDRDSEPRTILLYTLRGHRGRTSLSPPSPLTLVRSIATQGFVAIGENPDSDDPASPVTVRLDL